MVPTEAVTAWAVAHPWPTSVQIEQDLLAAFGPYRPDGLTAAKAEANLRAKVNDPKFRVDIDPLVAELPRDYSIETAAELVINELHARLDAPAGAAIMIVQNDETTASSLQPNGMVDKATARGRVCGMK